MTATRQCPSCGAELPADAPGDVCVPCLLKLGLPDQPSLASATPKRFGDYELLEEIARGGMGVVYKARHLTLNRIVALKLILAGQFANETERKRFQFEAEAAARLEHPNIIPIHEVGEHEGRPFFSLKLIVGGSLADKIAEVGLQTAETTGAASGSPTPGVEGRGEGGRSARSKSSIRHQQSIIASLIAKIARAVHFAHQHGIIHRDLKPSNILLDESGEPHVTDFGLAKGVAVDGNLTVTEAVLGSPYYMSPEQAAGKTRQVSTAADIYSLGVILYELLTGKLPFKAETSLTTLKLVTEAEPPKPRSLNPAVDRDLETICLKCLEKDPTRRYASAEALAKDLDRWQENKPISARRTNLTERAWKWVKREPLKAAFVAVITVAVVGPWLVSRYYNDELPHMATQHGITPPSDDGVYLLKVEAFKEDRCTANFWRVPFEEPGGWPVRLEFLNVPDALLPSLRCHIRADIAGRPDPPRSTIVTHGQTFHLRVETPDDRNFYVASVGWTASNLLATASNAFVRLTILPEGDRRWSPKKP
ncbi:MAG: serine/threonine protein kinase [Verrucomicrobia bacterium]|nr:serine/threonine protein kinase [Verrucomicrobiota bacterium]